MTAHRAFHHVRDSKLTQDRYREICDAFHWQVPVRFNIARECCGRWVHERERIALYYEDDAGHTGVYTYRDLQQQANRLSNALVALGVKRGDRVAIVLPQRPETAIAHIACYQMGAVAMKRPSSTRAPGVRATASSTRCFTPASASTLPAMNSSAEPCVVFARTSCAFFNVRVRNKS